MTYTHTVLWICCACMCWVGGSIATGNVFLDTEYLLDKNYYITLQQNRITAY